MYTIQDLTNSRCAVINDGTLEELKKVLNLAFPNDTCAIQGAGTYYMAYTKEKWWGSGLDTQLPTQSVKDFLVEEEFVLPKEWYVKATIDNRDVLKKWRDGNYYEWNANLVMLSCKLWDNIYSSNITRGRFKEISYEQFCKYVLKQEIMNNRFPFMLSSKDAQRIIDIACNTWKGKLAAMWSIAIVLGKTIEITESFYKQMREACTAEQHKLFDTIFGKDIPEYQYKDGELVWIKNNNNIWELRYTTGKINNSNLECYELQYKTGETVHWHIYKPAPGVVLPD